MLIFNGVSRPTSFPSKTWVDVPALRINAHDRGARHTSWVRSICIHTTQGKWPQPIVPGAGKTGSAVANISYWGKDPNYASAHLLVDSDGSVCQCADLVSEVTWHATTVNEVSVGIEVCQRSDGGLYQAQLDTLVSLVDMLTAELGIQRQIPLAYTGKVLSRLSSGGKDFVGVFGHRDQTGNRGRGDPGDAIMNELASRGYERFDIEGRQDITVWKDRQEKLGLQADGVPGPKTVSALKSAGYKDGLWVGR